MHEQHRLLEHNVKAAFAHVPFPAHQGLRASMALDDYTPREQLRGITEREDIKGEWWEIPADELMKCELALAYLDPQGVEFYLPAYLMLALNQIGKRLYVLALLDPTLVDGDPDLVAYFEHRMQSITASRAVVCMEVLRYVQMRLRDFVGEEWDIERIERIVTDPFWVSRVALAEVTPADAPFQ